MSLENPEGDILNPGAAERIAERVVTRRPLYQAKDEEAPPAGQNWFEYNYKPMPAALSLRVQIDPKPLADILDPLIQESNMPEVIKRCRAARIEVIATPDSPIITLKIMP